MTDAAIESTELSPLLQQQAAEYVLGTLESPEREQFAALLSRDAQVAAVVAFWEQALAPLAEAIDPVTPPQKVWRRLRQRIQPAGLRRQLRWWQGVALASSLFAAVLLTVLVATPGSEPMSFEQTVVIVGEEQQPLWLLQFDLDQNALQVQELNPSEYAADDMDFELWLVRPDGKTAISLGLLPKSGSRELAIARYTNVNRAAAFAVSVEAAGGSTTGQHSDQVVYVAKL